MYIDIDAAGCSNTCRHCAAGGHLPYGKWFSLDELRRLRDEWGPLTIRFEPSLHPNFPEIYRPDVATRHDGWLVTNGAGLARHPDSLSLLAEMQKAGLHTLAFTLHGLHERHDWFVCRQGAFDDILLATGGARRAGFQVVWGLFVDRVGIRDAAAAVELALEETGSEPWIQAPYHRVGGRLHHYEQYRPALDDILKHQVHTLLPGSGKNGLAQPAALTAAAWLERWDTLPGEAIRHIYEPPAWPPPVDYEHLCIRITRTRKVYIDPCCSPPVYLGELSQGRAALLGRLESLPPVPGRDTCPDKSFFSPLALQQIHPSAFSVRYAMISNARNLFFQTR